MPPAANAADSVAVLKACILVGAMFAAQPGVDPLIKMTISHYQFEAIHPFQGGNGRTDYILNTLYLIEQELLTLPILYLKIIYIDNKHPASEAIYFMK